MNIYCVMDRVADAVAGQIFTQHGHPAAIRLFTDLLSDQRTTPGQHPADFDLVCLGYLSERAIRHNDPYTPDLEIGIAVGRANPEMILTGAAWLATQQLTLSKEA